MAVHSESGTDLLQRLAVRPKLAGLQAELFGDDGPRPGDVVEVNDRGCGVKTLLLTQWVVKCILPAKWSDGSGSDLVIGGLDVGVVYLSTDHHFSLLHAVTVLERTLKRILRQVTLPAGRGSSLVAEIRQRALKRLTLFQCFSKSQTLFTFCAVKTFILSHPDASVIVVDSLSAHYWEDRLVATNLQSLEQYYQALLHNLMVKLRQTNMTVVYTVQRFLRDAAERDADGPKTASTEAPFVYSVTLDQCDQQLTAAVENRRTSTRFSRSMTLVKSQLCFC